MSDKGITYIVLEDCFCEHYLHEISNYPREGLIEKKLTETTIVTHVKRWSNLLGDYIKVKDHEGVEYDIRPWKLRQV